MKLMIPRRPLSLVIRPHLIGKLNRGLDGKLILISAPPGFGKTTLIVEWLSQLPATDSYWADSQIGWVSLDESDNDLARFMTYVVGAVRQALADESWGEGVLILMQASDSPVHAAVSLLMNEVAALDRSLVLVLDDYHVIQQGTIHQAITYLLDHQPSNLRLVLITREEPPLPLARLRLRGELCELNMVDMRFSVAETADFFRDTKGISLTPEQVAALDAQAEGWVAGLQAAALSMQSGQDVDRFLEDFSGNQRFVLDYLVEEVYKVQPEVIQSFLRQTAVFDRFCAPLCDAVLEIEQWELKYEHMPLSHIHEPFSAQAILEYLESANLFVIPLDDHRHWYRYHHLFHSFLQTQLAQWQAAPLSVLHGRAADWYAQNGMVDEAIRHWQSAGDHQKAANVIVANARHKLMRGERVTLQRWLDALPADLVRSNPHLCLAQATALTFVRDIEGVEEYLNAAESAVAHSPDMLPSEVDALLGGVAVYRAMIALWQGRLAQTARLCKEALSRLQSQDSYLTGLAALLLGVTNQKRDLPQAGAAFASALTVGQETGDIMLMNTAASNLANVYIGQGKLHRAANLYHEAIAIASDRRKRPFPVAGGAFVGLAQINREWNNLDEAGDYLTQAITLAQSAGLLDLLWEAKFTLSSLHWARKDWDKALTVLSEGEMLTRSQMRPDVARRLTTVRARLALARGHVSQAVQWAQSHGLTIHDESIELDDQRYLVLARTHIAQVQERVGSDVLDQVLRLLARLEVQAEQNGHVNSQIAILILQSLAYDISNLSASAHSALQKALTLAEPGGYVRSFADEGQPMANLLRQLARTAAGQMVEYIGKLLTAIQESPDPLNLLEEPLTDRETEVLQLIVAGLSNQEIADTLVIALSTVKRHINHVYGKLEVGSRTQAVARARALNLLS